MDSLRKVFDFYLVADRLPCCKSPPLPGQASILARTQLNSLSLSISVSLCCTNFAIAQPFLPLFTFYGRGVGRSTRAWAGAMEQWVRCSAAFVSTHVDAYFHVLLHASSACNNTTTLCTAHTSQVAQLWHSAHTSGAEVGAAAAHNRRATTCANARGLRTRC